MKVEEIKKLGELRNEYIMAKIMETPCPYLKDKPIPKRSKEEVDAELKSIFMSQFNDIPLFIYSEKGGNCAFYPCILNRGMIDVEKTDWFNVFTFQEVCLGYFNPMNVWLMFSLHEDRFSDKLEEWLKDSEALLQKIALSGGEEKK